MTITRIVWTALAAATLVRAQQAGPAEITPRMIQVHYVNVDRLRELVSIPGVSVKADGSMHVLVVSGRTDAVAAIEEMVKKLDVPPPAQPEFELTGYLVSGSIQARADEIPTDLAPAVKQLHNLFAYKSYRVMDTFFIRSGSANFSPTGSPSTSGILPGTNSEYNFTYRDSLVAGGSVHFGELRLDVATPTTERNKDGRIVNRNVGIHTSVDVPEGQKVVVGKSSFTGGDEALILVLSVKIIK
jgi:hypothetical protein